MFQKIVRIIRPYNTIRTTKKQTEYKISKKLQSFLFPFIFFESLLFSPKYQIHDNIIKPNGYKATAFCIIGNFFVIIVWFWRGFSIDEFLSKVKSRLPETDKLQHLYSDILHNLNYSLFGIGFIINMFSSVTQSRNIVNLVVKIQKMLCIVNLNDKIFRKLIWRCWFYCFSIVVLFLVYYGTLHCCFVNDALGIRYRNFILDIPLMTFDVNMVFAAMVITLIRHIALEIIGAISRQKNNAFCKEMCEVYIEILQVFNIHNAVFQDLIFFNIFIAFLHGVASVEYSMVLLFKANSIESTIGVWIIILGFLTVKRILLLILLSVEEERLYDTMTQIRTISNTLLGIEQLSDAERRMHKNISRSFKAMFKKTSIRGFFEVDVYLPLELILSLTMYFVVVLQFHISL